MSYSRDIVDLSERILALMPSHPEILETRDPFELFDIDAFYCKDLGPSAGQASIALQEAKRRWRAGERIETAPALRRQIDGLRKERRKLQERTNEIDETLSTLELAESQASHPCSCVRLNRDIDVVTSADVQNRRREVFGLGVVADLLSADLDCPKCGGTGVPKEAA